MRRNKKMNQEKLAYGILKLAGAWGLQSIASHPDMSDETKYVAEDRLNKIASLGRSDMDEGFVQVALEMFDEDQLDEILAGEHLEDMFEKTAGLRSFSEMDSDTLEKIASDDATSARAVGNSLSDAAADIVEAIEEGKEEAESHPGGSFTPADNLHDTVEGYNPINNPEDYDIDKSAEAIVNDAYIIKQAAEESYQYASSILSSFGLE